LAISDALDRFANSTTTVSVRSDAKEILFSGGLVAARSHSSACVEQGSGIPRRIEIQRSSVIRKMTANSVASRLHSALVSFAPWDD